MAPDNSMTSRSPEESTLFRTALRRFPGGVLGGLYPPGDLQFVVKEARDAHLYDFSGTEYLDYVLGSGPIVLGHAHQSVIQAALAQLGRGPTYFQLSEPAVALVEEICRARPCAERVLHRPSHHRLRRHAHGRPVPTRGLHPRAARAGPVRAAQKLYVSLAHSEEDIQRTVQAFTAALEAVAEQRS